MQELNKYHLLNIEEAARKLGIDVDSISPGPDYRERLYKLIGDNASAVIRKIEITI